MVQIWVVCLIVAMALLYAIWYSLSRVMRLRLGSVHPVLGADQACGTCRNCVGCSSVAKVNAPSAVQPTTQVVRFYPQK